MKNFKEYLTESKKQYDFRIKIAGEFTTEQEDTMKRLLGRFTVDNTLSSVKRTKTPIQAVPLDFPQVKNCEVSIYEVTLDYPTTQYELTEYLSTELGVGKSHLVVRSPHEPTEEYQHQEPKREGALLNDPDYKEAGSPKFEDYYGDKYNSGFVKELNDNSTTLGRYAILYKKSGSADADAKGWVWGYINADGGVAETASKKGSSCTSCHSQADNIDYMLMNKYFP